MVYNNLINNWIIILNLYDPVKNNNLHNKNALHINNLEKRNPFEKRQSHLVLLKILNFTLAIIVKVQVDIIYNGSR
jgi:hypothetical protein